MSITANYIGRQVENLSSDRENEECVLQRLSNEDLRSFRSVFGFLNDKDRDILYLIFVSGKKQKDVQRILRRSQPSLCYDIKRIRRRLQYIFYIHSVFDLFVKFIREQAGVFSEQEMTVLILMFYTSSFTITSEISKISQVKVRYVFNRCIDNMCSLGLWEPYEIFMLIRENLNSVKRIHKRTKNRTLCL